MNSKIKWFTNQKRKNLRVLTVFDYTTARLLDEAGIHLLLVGDSLGMVSLGYPDTTHVTMADMVHHAKAVMRAKPKAPVIVDMPYLSYKTPKQALENAKKLMELGVNGVKLEGALFAVVKALTDNGIPVMGHLGMLPQSIKEERSYKVKGKSEDESEKIVQEALGLEEAGAFSIVLELVLPEVAHAVTQAVSIPTIGIGSGDKCDGQILVTHDLIGAFPWFTPKHVKPLANVSESIKIAAKQYLSE